MLKNYVFKILSTGEVMELRTTEEGASEWANFLCALEASDVHYREESV